MRPSFEFHPTSLSTASTFRLLSFVLAVMLRASLRSLRPSGHGSIAARAGCQWQQTGMVSFIWRQMGLKPVGIEPANKNQRTFADGPKPIVLPGSASRLTSEPPPPGPVATSESSSLLSKTPAAPTSTEIPASNVPLTPPPPPKSMSACDFIGKNLT